MPKNKEICGDSSLSGLVPAVLMGAVAGLILLLALTLLGAGLLWSGAVPVQSAGILLNGAAGLCALAGGRVAVGKGSGPSMITGSAAGGTICLVLLMTCLSVTGASGFHGQFLGILLMTLAGGCLAGLLGKRRKKKKKTR